MKEAFQLFPLRSLTLRPGMLADRAALNRQYMLRLKNENLLQNFYLEAGLWTLAEKPGDIHWGWESPTCQLRGHFLGHWLSAAARMVAATGDAEMKAKADRIVSELGRCQQANGGEWAGSIPEKYLDFAARGQEVWAPQYTLHKTLMGLWDMYAYADSQEALAILKAWADWFHRWSGQFGPEEMRRILDVETGGMLEIWADLYGVTQDPRHRELMDRYDRKALFDPLLAGEDALTNMHANTTIPEVLGAARAYEVTGDTRWKDIVLAYWHFAVAARESFCTGGQSCGEIWTPPHRHSARLGDKNQEHCTVYNMMRLAEMLLRWTGDPVYADYWEKNLYNGILAQQHPRTGQISYFLPLQAGARKKWGSETEDFWCCHGTLVQAHTAHAAQAFLRDEAGLVLNQYIPSEVAFPWQGVDVKAGQKPDPQVASVERPRSMRTVLTVSAASPVEMTLKIRMPGWVSGTPTVLVNGEPVNVPVEAGTYASLTRVWSEDTVDILLPKTLTVWEIPDDPEMVALLDGPVVLAGLCAQERMLRGDKNRPESLIVPDNEREWVFWRNGYRTRNTDFGFRFIPLHEVTDETYQVYFRVRE